MPSDSTAVDAALVAKLNADGALLAAMTNGVFADAAPQGATRFVIVSQMAHEDEYELNGLAFERFVYLVKAVEAGTLGANADTAAARIHTLLQDGTLAPTGYSLMNMHRTERVRMTETDDASDRKWQHRGGLYEIQVQPTA